MLPVRSQAPRIVGALLFALLVAAPTRAHADEAATPKAIVEWSPQWRRFRPWEYGATAVLEVGNWYLYYKAQLPLRAKWQGDNVFDDTVRDWLRARTPEGRARAAEVSDILVLGRYLVPFGIDLPVILLVHRRLGVTWQLLMIDIEAFAVAGFINNSLFYEVGRGRPDYASCNADPHYDPLCGSGNNASFPSGHTLAIATAAGLTCVNHRYLPIYGHPVADEGECVLMSLATVATGVARIMSDRHYTTDVLTGAAIGFATGYSLPWLLHYRSGGTGADASRRQTVVLPMAGPSTLGMSVFGTL